MSDENHESLYLSAPGVPPVRIAGYPKRRSSRSVERAARASESQRRSNADASGLSALDPSFPTDPDVSYAAFLVDEDTSSAAQCGASTQEAS